MHGGGSNNQWEGRVMNTKPAQNDVFNGNFPPEVFSSEETPPEK